MNIFTFRRTWHLLFSKTHTGARKYQPINKKTAPYKQLTPIRKALTWGKKLRLLIKKLFNKLTSGISRNNMIAMS